VSRMNFTHYCSYLAVATGGRHFDLFPSRLPTMHRYFCLGQLWRDGVER
jgi:hypothetical protein